MLCHALLLASSGASTSVDNLEKMYPDKNAAMAVKSSKGGVAFLHIAPAPPTPVAAADGGVGGGDSRFEGNSSTVLTVPAATSNHESPAPPLPPTTTTTEGEGCFAL